jgi:RNA polymerase sigma-70 factor (ECF subfamily)
VSGGDADRDMDRIYREHAKSVYRYLLSITRDEGLSEELTQETFYRAVYSIGSYDGSCKISVWLCQIAKHIWFQELDRRAKYKTQALDGNIPAPSAAEDDAVLAGEKAALYKAIHSLGEPMKEVVLMRLSGELSFAEIGEIMEKNENWARTTFYRAKQKIMEVL